MGTNMPTLEQVALAAGVSRSTASRAINGGSKVSIEAQKAVDSAIARLGYVPNRAARSLVTKRTDSIALIVPEQDERVLSDPFFAAVIRGLNAALKETEIQLVLLIANPGDPVSRVARYLNNGHLDGAIIVSHHQGDEIEEVALNSRTPCVFVGRPFDPSRNIKYVDLDNKAGGRIATEHLIAHGRTNIAHLSGPSDMSAGVDRSQGWQEAIENAGLRAGPVFGGDFTTSAGVAAMESILAADPTIDAVFAASDLMALGALQVLRERNLRVPEDVAVVGFDNIGVSETSSPALTTVINPVSQMTRWAATELLYMINRITEEDRLSELDTSGVSRSENSIILPAVLVERAST